MGISRKVLSCVAVLALVFGLALSSGADGPLVNVGLQGNQITLSPAVPCVSLDLALALPNGSVHRASFGAKETAVIHLADIPKAGDGSYTYELTLITKEPRTTARSEQDNLAAGLAGGDASALVQVGTFLVRDGSIISPAGSEPLPDGAPAGGATAQGVIMPSQLIAEDLIVTGSICTGFDCVVGEVFAYDTMRLKENNVRISFMDTSTGTFPTTDWTLIANDTTNGGANYFAIEDTTGGRMPFRVTAGAPSHSLFVDGKGDVGMGTATPVLDLHVSTGDTPGLRLEQNGSMGWVPQKWDVAANETNFFIRDSTYGATLPFRIKSGTPTNTLTLANGNVGIGTWTPAYMLDVQGTGKNVDVVAKRTDGATAAVQARAAAAAFGSVSNHDVYVIANSVPIMTVKTSGKLIMSNGATLSVGGVWTDASSRDLKENISALTGDEAMAALGGLTPVKYAYKAEAGEQHVGFIAEDVPELVASNDRKGLSPMDIVAVLTRTVQEQQKMIEKLEKRLSELETLQAE